MRTVAIITARGGSKRIPRKNIKEFCGKPILAYSILAAVNSGMFDEVMVSTDDEEISMVAKEYGAKVPFFRSAETSNDYAATNDVIMEVLKEYEKLGQKFDYACCIYPTAPFISAGRLREAMEKLINSDGDSLMPVVRFSFPPQRCVVIENDLLRFKWPEYAMSRSQDLQPFYHDVGQFYCLKVDSFMEQNKLIMRKTLPLEIPDMEAQDIDTMEDWKIAELKYKVLRNIQ